MLLKSWKVITVLLNYHIKYFNIIKFVLKTITTTERPYDAKAKNVKLSYNEDIKRRIVKPRQRHLVAQQLS
jgi:hypothetical protein